MRKVDAKLRGLIFLEQTMTPSISTPNSNFASSDFVSTDIAALASHMSDCASKRSKFFGMRAAFEVMHSALFGRMVTAAVIVGVSFALVGIV